MEEARCQCVHSRTKISSTYYCEEDKYKIILEVPDEMVDIIDSQLEHNEWFADDSPTSGYHRFWFYVRRVDFTTILNLASLESCDPVVTD